MDVYADLFDEDLDGVAATLDTAIRSTADQLRIFLDIQGAKMQFESFIEFRNRSV